jgi:hypothetical protein
MHSVPITTNIMSSNPAHGEVYSIQHYVMKLISGLQHIVEFSLGTLVSSTHKTDRHDKTVILLKIVLKHHNPNPHLLE